MKNLALLLLPALLVASVPQKPKSAPKPPAVRRAKPLATARQAQEVAERETGGIAVSARRIPLNGASGGWEVDVHLPKDTRGWRCIIDNDTHMVSTKTRIPNPARPGRK
jgi:hypothetical protein